MQNNGLQNFKKLSKQWHDVGICLTERYTNISAANSTANLCSQLKIHFSVWNDNKKRNTRQLNPEHQINMPLPFSINCNNTTGHTSAVTTVTCSGLDSPGIDCWWGARLSTPAQTDPGAHPASSTVGTGSLRGVKRSQHDADHPPLSNTKVKERVELYRHSPSRPSWPTYSKLYLYL